MVQENEVHPYKLWAGMVFPNHVILLFSAAGWRYVLECNLSCGAILISVTLDNAFLFSKIMLKFHDHFLCKIVCICLWTRISNSNKSFGLLWLLTVRQAPFMTTFSYTRVLPSLKLRKLWRMVAALDWLPLLSRWLSHDLRYWLYDALWIAASFLSNTYLMPDTYVASGYFSMRVSGAIRGLYCFSMLGSLGTSSIVHMWGVRGFRLVLGWPPSDSSEPLGTLYVARCCWFVQLWRLLWCERLGTPAQRYVCLSLNGIS